MEGVRPPNLRIEQKGPEDKVDSNRGPHSPIAIECRQKQCMGTTQHTQRRPILGDVHTRLHYFFPTAGQRPRPYPALGAAEALSISRLEFTARHGMLGGQREAAPWVFSPTYPIHFSGSYLEETFKTLEMGERY